MFAFPPFKPKKFSHFSRSVARGANKGGTIQYKLPRLDSHSFEPRKYCIRCNLEEQEAIGVLDKDEPSKGDQEILQWKRSDAEARNSTEKSLCSSEHVHVPQAKTAKEMMPCMVFLFESLT